MESVLLVSCSEKGAGLITELLYAVGLHHFNTSRSCGEARRLMLERDFDLVIVDSPLKDESGEEFSRQTAVFGISQIMLLVRSEHFDDISASCEDDGVLTIAKPIDKTIFWSALKLAKAVQSRLKRSQDENAQLRRKIEDIRIIDRAKCILISNMCMSEQEAHRFIEKKAMNMRSTRREIAEGILTAHRV